MKYCIWNNKGGVGKTFLTYCLSVEYAIKNPEKNVVVVDMCPQANISEMLLGGNGIGEENLNKCFENDRTIASYIKSRYDRSRFSKLGSETSYFVKVGEFNKNMPNNLILLPGDTDLDICSSIIDYLAQAPERGAWLKSRKLLFDLIDTFEQSEKERGKETTFFIDCNPSFANYTQLAVISSDRLIVPCTGDSASIRGIYNIFRLIYGLKDGKNLSDDNIFDVFNIKVESNGIKLPQVHCFLLNKSRTMEKKATIAYNAHVKQIKQTIEKMVDNHSDVFSGADINRETLNIKDGNNLALVVNYHGLPISKLKHDKYPVYGVNTQVNQTQIDPFLRDVLKVVEIL